MEYTEQELDAVFAAVMEGASNVERRDPGLRAQIRTSVEMLLDGRAQPSRRYPYALDLPVVARLMREAREQGRKEGAAYHADDVALARSPLAASCVRQGVSAQAAANAFEYELHELTQEFIRHKTNAAAPIVVALDAVSADLIKRAREQGAAEMRERAALVAMQPDICPVDGPVAAERIRSLPLSVPK